jgi:hypothetical protein
MDHFRPIDKFELGECKDAAFVERGLKGEVEAREVFYGCEPCPYDRRLDAAVLTQRELFHQQVIERLVTVDLACSILRSVTSSISSPRAIFSASSS